MPLLIGLGHLHAQSDAGGRSIHTTAGGVGERSRSGRSPTVSTVTKIALKGAAGRREEGPGGDVSGQFAFTGYLILERTVVCYWKSSLGL